MGNPLLDEEYFQSLPQSVVDNLQWLNEFIINTICKRIKAVGRISSIDAHRLTAANYAGADISKINAEISRIVKLNLSEIDRIFENVGIENAAFSKPLFDFRNFPYIPFEQNSTLQSMVYAMSKITKGEYINLSRTAGFINKDGRPLTIHQQYVKIIDQAITAISTGVTDYRSSMRSVIKEMVNSGYRTISYESGYSRRLDTAVRQNILTGIKDISQEMQSDIGQAVGCDGYEISYHSNPRPSHVDMGGKQYTRKEFYRLGIDQLLQDYNCYHIAFDIIVGVSIPNFTKSELVQLKAKDSTPHEWKGQPISGYEATQRQRRYETKLRSLKDSANAFKANGDDLERRHIQKKIDSVSAEYARFSNAVGLSVKKDRASVAGYRRVKAG